ncbi:serine/threonine protein kinase [Streptomyces sp. NPDC002659]|uniref:serine/threonine protein kinase n=1 Tax=Streptomyces sp. NPDC002659 TaxID=3364656 RepID=UPI00369694A2
MTGHKVCGKPLADGDPESIGDFVLEGRLGTGGMGVVYLARSALGRQVAVKVVHERFAEDPEFRARFRQEVNAVRRVSGAFTAPVIDADTDCVFPWMATQYISGMPLSDRVKKHGPLSSDQLWRLAAGLAEASRDIHRAGVVHRDLKPANVLMHHDGPRVIDFGISRAAGSEVRTRTGQVMGTPPFMAPEQFVAAREVGPAADVFALGSVLVYAATGHGPFDIDNPNVAVIGYRVVHDEPNVGGLSGVMREIVTCCLEKAAEKRPTAQKLLDMLHSVQTEHERLEIQEPSDDLTTALATNAPTKTPPARRWPMRSATVAAGALCFLAAAFFATGADTNTSHSVPQRTSDVWRPWRTVFPASDRHDGPRVCTPDASGVFCSSFEIALMKLDPATGRTSWQKEMRDIRPGSGSSITPP